MKREEHEDPEVGNGGKVEELIGSSLTAGRLGDGSVIEDKKYDKRDF